MALSRITRAFAAGLALSTGAFAAQAEAVGELDPAAQPSSLSGSYLAGRSADSANDVDAALAYFSHTLEYDPGNPVLAERVLILQLAAGDVEPSLDLAEKLIIADTGNPTARIALASAALKQGKFALAKRELFETAKSPLATLAAGVMSAWADHGLGNTDDALKTVDGLVGPAWYDIFKDYHRALIADAAGRETEADESITRAYESDATALRIVEAYARIKGRSGESDEAVRALTAFADESGEDLVLSELLAELEAGKVPDPITTTPQGGAAELLYGLGSAIGTEDGTTVAAGYLQLSHYLDPSNGLVALALGDLFRRAEQCEKAIETYGKVAESSPLQRNAAIQSGLCLDAIGQTDEGAAEIRRVVDGDPSDIEAAIALGNLYRSHDRFAESAEAYTLGVNAITDESKADWRIYYFRGVSYERTKRWPEAEADFKRALELNPNQPQVLNYLGYSWVDMGVNLDEALDMIRTAVDLRPNDGYIVDSLGWAYYRLKRYQDAVEQLERAVELRPEDPVINDHLGDAYWQVGRKREALFQWAHARDLEPEETALPKILEKLQHGLSDAPQPEATPDDDDAAAMPASGTAVASVNPAHGAQPPSSWITVRTGDNLSTIAERIYGDPERYLEIFDANKEVIADPNVIHPGMTLRIPGRD